MFQGALALIRVIVWVWDPSWDDSSTILEPMYGGDSILLYAYGRSWDYDLTETRLAVLWASLHSEFPEWLRNSNSSPDPFRGQLSIPKWALPAFRPRNQNPEKMFELARKLRRDNSEWNESLRVLQSAEDFWDMPPSLFMAWVFAWPGSDSSWVGYGIFSCRIIRDTQSERLHFLPCWERGSVIPSMLFEDGVQKSFTCRVFGVPYNRNRFVFAFDEVPNVGGGPRQHKLVVGCDTPISEQNPSTPANSISPSLGKISETMDLMWKTLDPILEARLFHTPPPSSPAAATEPHSPTDPVRTSQQASPASSAIELATLPRAGEGRQPDAAITGPQPQRKTN